MHVLIDSVKILKNGSFLKATGGKWQQEKMEPAVLLAYKRDALFI